MNDQFEKQMEKKQKEMERTVSDMLKEREREKDEYNKREKEFLRKITDF